MKLSETIEALAGALASFNAETPNPAKDKTASVKSDKATYSYRYADLASVLETIRPSLAKNGLSVVQELLVESHRVGAVTLLLHKSGEFLEFDPVWMPAGGTPQQYGSAAAYSRRYSVMAALSLAAGDDDDDGAAAQAASRPAGGKSSGTPPATETQLKRIADVGGGLVTLDEIRKVAAGQYRVRDLHALTAAQASELIGKIEAEAERRREAAAAGADPTTGEVSEAVADPAPAAASTDEPAPASAPAEPEDPVAFGMDAEAFRVHCAGGKPDGTAPASAPPSNLRATNPQKAAIGRVMLQLVKAGDGTEESLDREICERFGVASRSELTKAQASELLDALIARAKALPGGESQ